MFLTRNTLTIYILTWFCLGFLKIVKCTTTTKGGSHKDSSSRAEVVENFWKNLERFELLEWVDQSAFSDIVQQDEDSSEYSMGRGSSVTRLSNETLSVDDSWIDQTLTTNNNGSLPAASQMVRNSTNCECGLKRGGTGKIVGGSLAEDKAWPWIAGLIYVGDQKPKLFCGGSLINNIYILTAAHCVVDMQSVGYQNFRIYLGTNLISGNSTNVTQVRISSVMMHPNYNTKTLNSDIALIRLANYVLFNDRVQPICLGQTGAPYIGRPAVVAGWGALSASTYPVNALRNVNVQVIENPKCANNYAKVKIRITPVMLCASLPKKDSCKGDSGGPLFSKRGKNGVIHDQIGVVSFGQDCAKIDFPGVYARVGRFIPWIKENTRDATYCTKSFTS